MLQRANPWQAYRQVATQTATPGQLVLQLYDGVLRFLEQARIGFTKDDPKDFNETINNNLQRAQAIIHELDAALNISEGGDFALTMRRLYDYFDSRLQESNVKKSDAGINEVARHITGLRDAWSEMLLKGGADEPAAAASLVAQSAFKSA
jgi:flagellar protein FliS